MITAYCMKCRKKGVEMNDPAIHKTKKGGFMAKGPCPTCNTTICLMMSKDNAEKAITNGVRKAY